MDLATARLTVAQGKTVPRDQWNHAQLTALWLLHQGEGRDMVLDEDAALQEAVKLYERELERQAALRAELVDIEPLGPADDEDDDDFTVDDRHGYLCADDGAYWIEAATGPGSPSR